MESVMKKFISSIVAAGAVIGSAAAGSLFVTTPAAATTYYSCDTVGNTCVCHRQKGDYFVSYTLCARDLVAAPSRDRLNARVPQGETATVHSATIPMPANGGARVSRKVSDETAIFDRWGNL
jgi:hypothetical protein